ncbi:hypothetical protein HCN44_007809 [Aphidius gifuensis]|uniref:Uncharacterized protein n=1 Tax=Aphidius gifuensis TaxID=684658 RepID=A0A835CLI8_APHGI|nr:hypothetical protein HCN44_007809 [Aphidius gifuensis]
MYQPIQKVGEYKLRWIVFYAILGSVTLTPTFITAANSTFDENNNYILDFGNVNSEINLCSKMGRWILKKNGSAVDSAITTMICNGIMTPSALGIGGGFLMTIYDRKNKQAHFLNAKEKAPLAAHKNMFKDNDKEPSKVGSLAIGVPGEVAGYWEAHQKFGKLAWFDLFEPNIQLCKIQSSSDRNIRPQFCDTIRTIAEKGANEFYNGTIGKKLIEDLNKLGSIMTIEDLKNYRVKWTDPIVNDFLNGTKLFTSNLPGSGGLLVLMLNIFDEFKFTRESIIGQENKIKTHHRIIETWKYAYAIRSQMGDPDFTDMTDLMKNITSKDFARMIKDKIDDQRTFNDPSHYGGGENLVEDHGTSHMSIIAPNGDAVAVTSSLNGHFGSGEISNQTGIILNNAMDDFSIPTVINTYSLPGVNKNNEVEGGKRPLSSMVPSIITTSNGDVRMVIGAAGGTQITTSVSYVIARHLFMAEPIREAIIAPRIHHQLYPMELSCGQMISYKIYYGLKKMGHVMGPDATSSSVIALVQINGTKNGSAVDSAITTMICNGIMTPSGLGIGGGFLMTIYDRKNKQAHFLNAKDKAPIASHKNIFEEDVEELSKIGSLAIGVPGEVAGYWEAHQKFGKLAWFDLFEPNIQLCEKQSSSDRNIRPQFCDTIRTIAEKGANEFYNGTIGKKLIEDLNKLGSIMTIEDLKNYRVKWTDPIVNDFLNGTKLFTSNLPGSGGLLVLMLNIFDKFKFTRKNIIGPTNKIKTYHRIIETWKYAYAIRSQMGDPDFTDMTDLIKNITSKDFARMIKDKIDHDKRTFNDPSHYGGGKNLVKDYGTSHMSIIAPNGDAVAVTSSLNGHFGSGEISNQTGIILNNAMDDFSIPTVINTYSLPGVNKNNEIEGGKRPLSSMVPSIITTSNGDVRMVIGAAGGTQITTSVSYVIARHLFMDESIQKAITAPRIHHQLYPKELSTDEAISQKISNGLENMGHVIGPYATASSVIALVQINGTVIDHLDS